MVFTLTTKRYLGDHATIVTRNDQGQEEPVMHIFAGPADFPGSTKELALNLASLMNNHEPPYQFETSQRLLWRETERGFEFRLLEAGPHEQPQEPHKGSISAGGPVASLVPGQEEYKDIALQAAQKQCAAISQPQRNPQPQRYNPLKKASGAPGSA